MTMRTRLDIFNLSSVYTTAAETEYGKSKEIQGARFLNWTGTESSRVYNTWMTEKNQDQEVSAILNRMEKYRSPRTNEIMAHYKFFSAKLSSDNIVMIYLK